MSNGRHDVRGLVYPDVVFLEDGMATWNGNPPGAHNAVIDSVDTDIDFDNFDANGDDIVDEVIICWRQVFGQTHALTLNGIPGESTLGLALDPKPVDSVEIRGNNGIYLAPKLSQRSAARVRGLALHEYGHDVLDALNAQGGFQLGGAGGHIKTIGRYGIMDGTDDNYYAGTIMETIMRWKLDWIEPKYEISFSAPGSQLLTLEDVGANGDQASFGVIYTADPKQYFVIECRDSTATLFTDGSSLGGACGGAVKGNSGLVIAHVSEHERYRNPQDCPSCSAAPANRAIEGWWLGAFGSIPPQVAPGCSESDCVDCVLEPPPPCPVPPCPGPEEPRCCPDENFPPTIDIEVPQGMIDTLTWVPDPVSGFDEMSCMACEDEHLPGDIEELWGNGVSNVFAPWTNPSTDLYWFVPNDPNETAYRDLDMCSMRREQSMYSGLTFYDIHWETEPGGGNGVMQVTVRYDDPPAANQPFVLPPDMHWDGKIRLTQDVEVPVGGTLTVNAGATVIASSGDLLAAGVDAQRVEIVVPASGNLVVAGTVGNEVTFTSSRDDAANTHYLGTGEVAAATAGDWYGIRVGDLDAVSFANAEFRYARGALASEDQGLTLAQLNTLLASSTLIWSNNVTDVSLDRDFLVDIGQTLTIPAGLKLGFTAGVDRQNNQPYEIDPLSELIILGRLLADGNATTHIAIRSDDPAPVGAADFYGVRCLDTADTTVFSSLSYVDFSGARYAFTPDSLSGNLIHCTFANSEKGDVYIDRDARIPPAYRWILDAPTKVVVNDDDLGADWPTYPTFKEEDQARVEVWFDGRFGTGRPPGAGSADSVWFTSVSASPAADDWFGISCRGDSSVFSYASVAHARKPIFFDGSGTARLWNSNVYDFLNTGVTVPLNVWIKNSMVQGSKLGTLIDNTKRYGVQIIQTAAIVESTTVKWPTTYNPLGGSTGLKVDNTRNYCYLPLPADTLWIRSNTFEGNGEASGQNHTGLLVSWGCEFHHPRIESNALTAWPKAGLHLFQCADTRVTCNEIIDNLRGISYTRTDVAVGDSVRVYQNELKGSNDRNLYTDGAYRLVLRPDTQSATEGKNSIAEATAQGGKNLESTDGAVTIDALRNTWWKNGSITTNLTEIASTIIGAVGYDPPLATELLCGGQMAFFGPEQTQAPEREVASEVASAAPLEKDLPTEFALAASVPNPVRGSTIIPYNVPAGYGGRVRLVVYDVRGRAVRTLVEGAVPPGRHRATWTGTDQNGSRVAAGVYFVHLRADAFRSTRAVTMVK
jgi:hypothetical protein